MTSGSGCSSLRPFDAESIIGAQNYTAGATVNRTLPAATGGADPLTYTLMPIPDWLTFDAADRILKGAPTTSSPAVTLTYAVTDANSIMAMQTFTVTVNAALGFDNAIIPIPDPAYTYTIGTTTSLTLPPTRGGTTPLTYTLTPTDSIPDGLTFNVTARTLAGMPTKATATAVVLTYAVTDANAAAVSLTFMVTVNVGPILTMADVSVNEGDAAGAATVIVSLDKAVDGGFMVDASTMNGGTATAGAAGTTGADYTAVNQTLTFNGEVGEIRSFSVPIFDDDLDEGAGETVRLSLGNLQGTGVPVDTTATATLFITDDDNDSALAVTSVGYFADEAATIAITEGIIDTSIYMLIQFNRNVQNTVTVFGTNFTQGRPRIQVRYQARSGTGTQDSAIPIIAHGTAFTDVSRCRARTAGDTSASYLCLVSLNVFHSVGLGQLQIRVQEGEAIDSAGNELAADYLDSSGIEVVAATTVLPSVTSVTHYSDAGRTTTISGTVTDGSIYSVIEFSSGLAIGTTSANPPILTAAARPQVLLPNWHRAGAVWRSCHHRYAAKRNLRIP